MYCIIHTFCVSVLCIRKQIHTFIYTYFAIWSYIQYCISNNLHTYESSGICITFSSFKWIIEIRFFLFDLNICKNVYLCDTFVKRNQCIGELGYVIRSFEIKVLFLKYISKSIHFNWFQQARKKNMLQRTITQHTKY